MTRIVSYLIIALCAVFLVACASTNKGGTEEVVQEPVDSVFAFIKRTPCYGTCPVYEITVYESGYAVYHAERFLDSLGKFEGWLTRQQIDSIKAYAKQVEYFSLDDVYDDMYVTDVPSTRTRMRFDGKDKSIRNRYKSPRKLASFEKFLDDKLAAVKWKRTAPAPEDKSRD